MESHQIKGKDEDEKQWNKGIRLLVYRSVLQNPKCPRFLASTYSPKVFHLLYYEVNAFWGQVQLVKSMQSKHILKNSSN